MIRARPYTGNLGNLICNTFQFTVIKKIAERQHEFIEKLCDKPDKYCCCNGTFSYAFKFMMENQYQSCGYNYH